MTGDCLVPEARDRLAAKDDGEDEANPPTDHDTTCDDRNDGKASDGEQSMVEEEQRHARYGYSRGKQDLNGPVVK